MEEKKTEQKRKNRRRVDSSSQDKKQRKSVNSSGQTPQNGGNAGIRSRGRTEIYSQRTTKEVTYEGHCSKVKAEIYNVFLPFYIYGIIIL